MSNVNVSIRYAVNVYAISVRQRSPIGLIIKHNGKYNNINSMHHLNKFRGAE